MSNVPAPRFLLVLGASLLFADALLAQRVDSAPDRGRRRVQLLPAIASAPETGVQYGVAALAVFERPVAAATRPSNVMTSLIRSAKGQTRFIVEGERWTAGNARRIAGSFVWQRFPLPFYGFGDSARTESRETFTPSGIEVNGSLQQRVRGPLYTLTALRVVDQSVRTDSAGALRSGTVTGSTGGRTVELSVGVIADSRNNLFTPSRGALVQLSHGRSARALGADYTFGRTRLDARLYRGIHGDSANRGVLSAHATAVGIDGDAPFDQVAIVGGGDIMRGYTRGRYRDRWLAAAQLEYRSPVTHRVGAVAFAGGGTVADRLASLGESRFLPSYGAGVRVQIDRKQGTAVRVDYGRGERGSSGLYVGFNHAF